MLSKALEKPRMVMYIVTIVLPFATLIVKFIKESFVWNLIEGLSEVQKGHVLCHCCPYLLQG